MTHFSSCIRSASGSSYSRSSKNQNSQTGAYSILGMDINLFKLCSGPRVLGCFVILLFAAIVAVTYDAVGLLTWGPLLLHGGLSSSLFGFAIIAAFHILFSTNPFLSLKIEDLYQTRRILEAATLITLSNQVAPETSASAWSSSNGLKTIHGIF